MTGNLGQVPCCDLSCQSWPRTFFITWRLGVRKQSYSRPLYAWLLTLSFFRCSMNTWHQIKISLEDQKKNPSWQNTCKLTSSVRTGAPPSPPLIPHDWLLCVWLGFTWKGSLTYVFQRNKKEPCTEGIGPGCHPALCQCILGLGTSSEAPVHNREIYTWLFKVQTGSDDDNRAPPERLQQVPRAAAWSLHIQADADSLPRAIGRSSLHGR